jgi:hypothetical protein
MVNDDRSGTMPGPRIAETASSAGTFALPDRGYNATVDYLRMIAAILIVLFHAHAPAGQFSVASVGVFAVFLAFFALRSAEGRK